MQVMTSQVARTSVAREPRFSGFTRVEPIADVQTGPTCGFEAIENLVQLFHRAGNDLTQRELLPRAQRHGVAIREPDGFALDVRGYQPLLADFGIATRWFPYDPGQVIIPALVANRGVLVVGDAHALDARTYPAPGSGHAFVITNFFTDEAGAYVHGFVGIDSNFAGRETVWPLPNVEAAAAWAARSVLRYPVLVTDMPGTWPSVAKYYRQTRTGQLEPVY